MSNTMQTMSAHSLWPGQVLNHRCEVGAEIDPVISRVLTAAIVKFGGEGRSRQEAVNQFIAGLTEVIGEPVDVEFSQKLEALKKSVGEDTFNKMLANPRIESLAASAWQEAQEKIEGDKLGNFLAQFNGAITPEDIDYFVDCFEQAHSR